jgi:arylsulfatase A-like enzyme
MLRRPGDALRHGVRRTSMPHEGRQGAGGGLPLALVLLAILSGCADRRPVRTVPPPPSVILLSVDTLQRSALRAFDPSAPALPAIDALGEAALRFERAYSTAPWTLAAHASMLTGLYPDRHGAVHRKTALAEELPRLASALRAGGLETVAFTGGGYLDRKYGFAPGFDRYDDWTDPGHPWTGPRLPRSGAAPRVSGEGLFDRAVAYLRKRRDPERGFFLFLHTFVVHDYFHANPWAVRKVGAGEDERELYLDCLKGKKSCGPEVWQRLEALYRAELQRLDAGVGDLIEALEWAGLRESTYIVFVSDHGEGFDHARGRVHHGGRLHEDQLRIPLLVSGPGISAGSTARPVSLVDVMPTLLELLDRPVPDGLDGHSFASALRGEGDGTRRPLYAADHFQYWQDGRRYDLPAAPDVPLGVAVLLGDEWFIHRGDVDSLYDMRLDPGQRRNLAPEEPERTNSWREVAADLWRTLAERRPDAPEVELDPELEEKLRALGYID